jgi:hypothetical protein
MAIKPKYIHDCNNCTFLGRYNHKSGKKTTVLDLYCHAHQDGWSTFIARYGNEGQDYSTAIVLNATKGPHQEAYKRAKAKGILSPRDIFDAEFPKEFRDKFIYVNNDATAKELSRLLDDWRMKILFSEVADKITDNLDENKRQYFNLALAAMDQATAFFALAGD